MPVIEALSDEEAYLWTILQDESGIDQAEFCWYDGDSDDGSGCFRAWPFQWQWWRSTEPLQIDQCARAVGKSRGIELRACAFPFLFANQELVITAPEANHLEAITDLIETQVYAVRLTREMVALNQNRLAITHKPFKMNFANGSRILGRIPQRDGRGVKGTHPMWLELDEAADYPDRGWIELIETLKRGDPRAMWRAHGVTRGVRDFFYKFTQPGSGWAVHRHCAMERPNWSDQERAEKIENYGGRDSPDYRRNVLGLHGDATNPIFVLHRLMQRVDDDATSDYNASEYCHLRITEDMIRSYDGNVATLLQFPGRHLDGKYGVFWAGMDVGWTTSPSEILIFGEHHPLKTKPSVLRLLTRVHLARVASPDQVKAVKAIIAFYRPKVFAMDATGAGLPLFQDLQRTAEEEADPFAALALEKIKGYKFNEKILVDFDQRIEVDEFRGDAVKEAGIERVVLEYATDRLRGLVDDARIELPWDTDLLGEFQGATYSIVQAATDEYGRRRFSKGKDHALDASRMAALGWAQFKIEEMMKQEKQQSVYDMWVDPSSPY